jgi:hypothetical protein
VPPRDVTARIVAHSPAAVAYPVSIAQFSGNGASSPLWTICLMLGDAGNRSKFGPKLDVGHFGNSRCGLRALYVASGACLRVRAINADGSSALS